MFIQEYQFSECRDAVNICADCPCTITTTGVLQVGLAEDPVVVQKRKAKNSFRVGRTAAQNGNGFIPAIPMTFGQDFEFGAGGTIPGGKPSQGANAAALVRQMEELREEVSRNDVGNLSAAYMGRFTSNVGQRLLLSSTTYNARLSSHKNIQHFMEATLAAPGLAQRGAGKVGLHQALVRKNMDISAVALISDLGVPALNIGDPGLFRNTGDWNNGLAFMVNGIQYVFVFVTYYCYNQKAHKYDITLEYHFFDVFGLDDDDVLEYGGSFFDFAQGVTAWWQLQHQYGYAPHITRGITSRTFTVNL
jgi:hypothetical protein